MAERTEPEILVPISLAQAERVVQQIVGSTAPGVSLVRVLLALAGNDRVVMADLLTDPDVDHNMNQHLLTGLVLLTTFHSDKEHRITDLAAELGISVSTTHRYLKTWVAVGVLEQDKATRKYRLADRWRNKSATNASRPAASTKR
jgi:predicted transcriptional regulator